MGKKDTNPRTGPSLLPSSTSQASRHTLPPTHTFSQSYQHEVIGFYQTGVDIVPPVSIPAARHHDPDRLSSAPRLPRSAAWREEAISFVLTLPARCVLHCGHESTASERAKSRTGGKGGLPFVLFICSLRTWWDFFSPQAGLKD